MAKVVTPIFCKVEVIGKIKEGNYGPYRPVLFVDLTKPDGSESGKIWKSLTEEEAAPLEKGFLVQLVPAGQDKAGNDKHNIVIVKDPPAALPTMPMPSSDKSGNLWTNNQKRQMAGRAQQYLGFMEFCLKQTRQKFPDLSEEAIAVLACKLFDSARGGD